MKHGSLIAGAAFTDITPPTPHFLHGYPFVERISTGTHDPLLSSALFLSDGRECALFLSNDVLYLDKGTVARIRDGISERTGVPSSNIMVAATHTHSGPVTVDCAASSDDPVVPPADRDYLGYMEEKTIEAACLAFRNAAPAGAAFINGDASGTGGNRHDPAGAKDMNVPAVVVRDAGGRYVACMLVCSMHPTILHEDSTLYSSDFPHYVRQTLQSEVLGEGCPVIYFTGAAGDQSPRHAARENTFDEAHRLGRIVAGSLISALASGPEYSTDIPIRPGQTFTDLPRRTFPDAGWAERHRDELKRRFETLRQSAADPREIRTAEVDWFGSEELLTLSRLACPGGLESIYGSCLPAEIQAVGIGGRWFAAWPGEVFAGYGLGLKAEIDEIALITYANGELQGYITTKEAHEKGYYESGNSFFDHTAGDILVKETMELISRLDR